MLKEQSEALGGCCNFANNPSGGAIFSFSVPFSVVSSLDASLALEGTIDFKDKMTDPSPEAKSVLLIDNVLVLLKMTSMALELEGYVVTIAQGAAEGLKLMQTHVYTIVLCDLRMPHKNGYEAARELRAWEAKVGLHLTFAS